MYCRHITQWCRFTGVAVVVTAYGSCAQGPRYDGDFWQSKSIADFTFICSRAIREADSVEEANARLRSLGLTTVVEESSDGRILYSRTGPPDLERLTEPIYQELFFTVRVPCHTYFVTDIEVTAALNGL
jgi:hypothetical protein